MAAEGYLARVDLAFACFGALVIVGAAATARALSTRRLLALFLIAGSFGLLTQAVGTDSGAWRYRNPAGGYFFVFFAFGFGSVFDFGVVRALSARRHSLPPIAAVAALGAVLVLGAVGLLKAAPPRWTLGFGIYYATLVVASVGFVRRARPFTTVWSLLVGAAFGLVSESLGARAGLWQFASEGTWVAGMPPLWLVATSWPLETLLHFGLAAAAAREPIEIGSAGAD